MVSSEKVEQEAQKIPVVISVTLAKQVANYRLWNVKDLTAIIPNMYSVSPGDDKIILQLGVLRRHLMTNPLLLMLMA